MRLSNNILQFMRTQLLGKRRGGFALPEQVSH
jgi:hypothetical protein